MLFFLGCHKMMITSQILSLNIDKIKFSDLCLFLDKLQMDNIFLFSLEKST